MEVLGFLTVIAAQLLRMTYSIAPNQAPASIVLRPVHQVILAKSSLYFPLPKALTWAIQAVARLGATWDIDENLHWHSGLWRGWLQLESLCEGWQLCSSLN